MKQTLFAIIVVISFMFSGCIGNSSVSLPSNQTVSSLPATATILVTSTPMVLEITPTPSVTSNPVSTPTLESVTPTITISPPPTVTKTPIPIPTPPNLAIPEQTLWLFETNNSCQLPCWWGITPGQTSWETAKEFLAIFDQNIYETSSPSGLTYYGVSMPVPPEIFVVNYIEVGFLVREGLVEEIISPLAVITPFPLEHFIQYTLPLILDTYGKPSEIWISTYSDAFEEGDLPFILILVYFDQGILISYGANGEPQNDLIQGCFYPEPATRFYLWLPELYSTFHQATNGKSISNRDYLSLEEATSMDVATFYETFKNPDNTVCLETPANLWEP